MSDISSLANELSGAIISSSSPDYVSAIGRVSHLAIRKPSYVGLPETFEDVPKLIKFARSNQLELAVKGGGANLSSVGISSTEGGLVIDLSKLKKVQISDDKGSVVVQGGAVWGDVYEPLSKAGLDVVGGSHWSVGVGGFLTGGGWSHLNGTYGMGCDNIIAATVALADGSIVKANAETHPDLFLAIRGGQGKFGIVLEFVLRVYITLGPLNTGILVTAGDGFDKVVPALQQTLQNFENHDRLMVTFLRDDYQDSFLPGIAFFPTVPGPPERAEKILAPIKEIAGYTMLAAVPNQLAHSHGPDDALEKSPKRVHAAGSQLQDIGEGDGFDTKLFKNIWERWLKWTGENDRGKKSIVAWEWCRAGVVKSSPAGETAFNKRDSTSLVIIMGKTRSSEFDQQVEAWSREMASVVRATRPDGGVNPGCSNGDETVEEVFGEQMAKRLRGIKTKYDPENIWTKGFRF